ncbi:MAG TPA: hypothetical protein DCW68_06945 [Rhodospirillaceae bacterium]|nr:hypothetical protein [Rhodospirillaceae bacterium]
MAEVYMELHLAAVEMTKLLASIEQDEVDREWVYRTFAECMEVVSGRYFRKKKKEESSHHSGRAEIAETD